MTKEFKKFTAWCKQPNPKQKTKLSLPSVEENDDHQIQEKFFNQLNNLLAQTGGHPFDIALAQEYKSNSNVSIKRDEISEEININHLFINTGRFNNSNILLENLSINVLEIHGPVEKRLVIIENCEIKELQLKSNTSVSVKNSMIGTVEMYNESVIRYLKVENGCILNFDCPTPGKTNPINGPVIFKNVFLPKNTRDYLLKDAQPYRNLRHFLREIENNQMSNFIHSAEMAVERENEPFVNKLVSYFYQGISDYGSSWFRPLVWLIALTLLSTAFIFCFDGAQVRPDISYEGWQSELVGNNDCAKLKRSLYLSAQSTYNLFSLFRSQAIILPSNGLVAFLTWLQTIFSIIIIALMIFAIRRRFKIQN